MHDTVVPLTVFSDDGWRVADRDEFLRPETTVESIADLPTPFRAGGRVTAGNSAGLTDGATAACSRSDAVDELGLEPPMRLVGYAFAGVEPELMGLGPVPATKQVLEHAGLTIDDVGLFELNEPFAVQVLTWCDGMGVSPDDERLNPYGGAIACGHPLAATGVRLMAQLAYGFRERPDVRYGLTALCIGMGMGAAVLWENTATCLTPQFHLQRVDTRLGPLALLTMDNGADHTKPTVLGRSAIESARRALDELEGGDWIGARRHRQAVRLRRGRRHRRVSARAHARGGARRQPRRARPLRPHPRPALSRPSRRSTARASAAASRSRCTATRARSRRRSATSRAPKCFLGIIPALGRHPARSRGSSAPQKAVRFIVLNPMRQNQMLAGRGGVRAGASPTACSSRRVPGRVDRVRAGARRAGRHAARARPISRTPPRSSPRRRQQLDDSVHGAAPAPYRALDLIEGAATWSVEEGYRAEEEALADLLPSPQAQASLYAFDLVERRAKRSVGHARTSSRAACARSASSARG